MRPKKLKIFYKTYKIKYIDELLWLNGDLVKGTFESDKKLICISTIEQSENEIFETLIHEILHLIVHEMSIAEIKKSENEEEIIDALTTVLLKLY